MKKFIIIIIFLYSFTSYCDENKVAEELYEELRCLVCQNQSIKESDAPLAKDLKLIVLEELKKGKNKEEIKSFLVDKYGEFILFRPTYSLKNIFLWFAPIICLLIGTILVFRSYNYSRKTREEVIDLTVSEKKKLRTLLNEDKKI